jgi:hypothetical protein
VILNITALRPETPGTHTTISQVSARNNVSISPIHYPIFERSGSIIVFMGVIAKNRVGSILFNGGLASGDRRLDYDYSAPKCRPRLLFHPV